MKFSTEVFKKYSKVFSNLDGNFIFLDSKENKIYCNGTVQAVRINCNFEDVKNDENKVYCLDKSDFLHAIEFSNTLEMDKDYKYIDDKKTIKGTFKHNDDYCDNVSIIKEKFDDVESFDKTFDTTPELLNKINRASIFVNPTDIKVSFRNLNIKDNMISSSSDFKVFVSSTTVDKDCLISSDTLKFISIIGNDVEVYNTENQEYLLKFADGEIYFNAPSELDYLPINGQFKDKYSSVFDKTVIKVNSKEMLDKLGFISYYASNVPSTRVDMKYNGDKVTLEVGETSVVLDITSIESSEKGELVLPFNSNTFTNVISKLSKDEDITISVSKDSSAKLFVLNFDKDEDIVLAKLNI